MLCRATPIVVPRVLVVVLAMNTRLWWPWRVQWESSVLDIFIGSQLVQRFRDVLNLCIQMKLKETPNTTISQYQFPEVSSERLSSHRFQPSKTLLGDPDWHIGTHSFHMFPLTHPQVPPGADPVGLHHWVDALLGNVAEERLVPHFYVTIYLPGLVN